MQSLKWCARRAKAERGPLRTKLLALLALAGAAPASAENADFYRGGWRTAAGDPLVYEFVIRGGDVSGIACTYCSDGTTLARIEGTFSDASGLVFTVRHLKLDGTLASQERLRARLVAGKLRVTGSGPERVLIKDPRGPTPGGHPSGE